MLLVGSQLSSIERDAETVAEVRRMLVVRQERPAMSGAGQPRAIDIPPDRILRAVRGRVAEPCRHTHAVPHRLGALAHAVGQHFVMFA